MKAFSQVDCVDHLNSIAAICVHAIDFNLLLIHKHIGSVRQQAIVDMQNLLVTKGVDNGQIKGVIFISNVEVLFFECRYQLFGPRRNYIPEVQ